VKGPRPEIGAAHIHQAFIVRRTRWWRATGAAGAGLYVAGRIVLVVSNMLGDLRLQGGLEHRLGQPGEHPTRSDQIHSVRAGFRHQIPGKLC
jgi:hypothetical protein